MEQVREALISDTRSRFAVVGGSVGAAAVSNNDDDDDDDADVGVGLAFRRRASSSSNMLFGKAVLDGLVAGVNATTTAITKTASVTTGAVKGVGRGIGAAGSAVSLAVAAVVTGGGRASGCQSGVPAPTDTTNPPDALKETLSGLSPEQIEQLGRPTHVIPPPGCLCTSRALDSVPLHGFACATPHAFACSRSYPPIALPPKTHTYGDIIHTHTHTHTHT
jgi:hypothetical protein